MFLLSRIKIPGRVRNVCVLTDRSWEDWNPPESRPQPQKRHEEGDQGSWMDNVVDPLSYQGPTEVFTCLSRLMSFWDFFKQRVGFSEGPCSTEIVSPKVVRGPCPIEGVGWRPPGQDGGGVTF